MVDVEVVYAAIDRQVLLSVSVPAGTTVRAALLMSGVGEAFAELDLADCPVGIFGKVIADPDKHPVQAGDRIEIYRPLLACLLYTSPSPRDLSTSRMPSSA